MTFNFTTKLSICAAVLALSACASVSENPNLVTVFEYQPDETVAVTKINKVELTAELTCRELPGSGAIRKETCATPADWKQYDKVRRQERQLYNTFQAGDIG